MTKPTDMEICEAVINSKSWVDGTDKRVKFHSRFKPEHVKSLLLRIDVLESAVKAGANKQEEVTKLALLYQCHDCSCPPGENCDPDSTCEIKEIVDLLTDGGPND